MITAIKRKFTIWRFSSPTTGETKIVAKPLEIDDRLYDHQYQRVLWQGEAYSAQEALREWQAH
jgi:hypothetical protein